MTVTISRLYDKYEFAARAVNDLEAAGIPHADISLVANDPAVRDLRGEPVGVRTVEVPGHRAEGAEVGGGIGAALGGTTGVLAGLGIIAIPGIGPVVAAGWLATAAAGAVAAGTVGGIIGALTQSGTKKEQAVVYAEAVRRGGTLVSARVPEADQARYEAILDRAAVNLTTREAEYRSGGWSAFDDKATPYTTEELTRMRDKTLV